MKHKIQFRDLSVCGVRLFINRKHDHNSKGLVFDNRCGACRYPIDQGITNLKTNA